MQPTPPVRELKGAVLLFALPAVFNVPGDKASTVVATPGFARIGIEMLLTGSASAAAWYVWPMWAAAAVSGVGAATIVTGWKRYRWLLTSTGEEH